MGSLLTGQSILHYRVVNEIGRGGMGEVYKAEDLKLGRLVAIKVLPSQVTQDDTARQRLVREARSASALNHPNIVTIHSIDEANGLDFIVMEYVEGESVRARIGRDSVELRQLLEWGAQVADALAAAHAIGLVHRDIKPANIVLTARHQAKVLDFGLAKMAGPGPGVIDTGAVTGSGGLTNEGVILGTAAYMSPEQTRGEALDGRSDVFSLGIVLYEASTGKLPFSGPSMLSLLHEIAAVDPPPPSRIRPDLPPEFDVIVERALAKDKQRRYSASELFDALRGLRGSAESIVSGAMAETEQVIRKSEAFVGREAELKRLEGFLRQAVEGTGRVVFITGEPGIGKTALADEFLGRARQQNAILCRGRCAEQYGTGEAYLPFLDALGALLAGRGRERIAALLRIHAPTWCLQFPAAFASSGALEQLQRETIGATKERMLRELSDALGALATSSPVVLLLEDLHWADPSSVDLLRHLSHRIREQRLLIVGTFRPEDVELSNHPIKNSKREMQAQQVCEEVALGLLGTENIAGYLDAKFTPNHFPPDFAALIERKTEGHPLFATSLIQFLAERGDITKTNEHWSLGRELSKMDLEVPESVRGMIRKKIEVLEDEDRRALQYASIEGEEFTSTVVAHLLGVDDLALEERLDRLGRIHRLIQTLGEEEWPDGTLGIRYRFAHALYQNVLYADLVSKRRILLHRQAGEKLVEHYGDGAARIAAQLAMHFERGRDFSRAIAYLTQAGDNATKVYASAEAEKHYSRALGLVEKLPAAERTDTSVSLYQKRGTVNNALSRFDQAVDDFKQMLDHARAAVSSELEHAALNAMATTLFWSHRLEEFQACVEQAFSAADASGKKELRLDTMALLGLKHHCYGELAEEIKLLDELILSARALQHKPALLGGLLWRGQVHFFQSEYDRAEKLLEEVRSLASELRDGFNLLICLFTQGMVQGNQGRMSKALGTLTEAIEMGRRNGDHFMVARLPNCLGWIYRELQDFAHAVAHDQRGVELAREDKILEAEANSLINLGYDYTHQREGEKPAAAFRNVEEIFARDSWMRWRYNIRLQAGQAEFWLSRGNTERAEEFARRLLETATHFQARKYIAVAHKLLAEAAIARDDLITAETELQTALGVLRQFPVPIVAWKTYAVLGRLRLKSDQRQAAREAFAQAAGIVHQIAANVTDEKLRATFLNSTAVKEVLEGADEG